MTLPQQHSNVRDPVNRIYYYVSNLIPTAETPPIHFNVSAMGVKGNGCSRLRCRPFYVNACPFPGETILFNCAAGGRNSSTPIIRTPSGPAPATFVVNNCPRSNIDGRYTCFSSNECGLGESSITLQVFGECITRPLLYSSLH